MIENLHPSKAGYTSLVNFLNTDVSTIPEVVQDCINDVSTLITSQDFVCFIVELYGGSTHVLTVIAYSNRLFILDNDDNIVYYNFTDVENLFTVDNVNGLTDFFSNTIALTSLVDENSYELQVYKSIEIGTERYLVTLKEAGGVSLFYGTIQARTTVDTIMGSYNVKLLKEPISFIPCISALNQKTHFMVSISEISEILYSYNNQGEILQIIDTPYSRLRIKQLVLQGVLFADIPA